MRRPQNLENILTKHVFTRSLLSPSLTFVDLVMARKAKIKVSSDFVRRPQNLENILTKHVTVSNNSYRF